MQSQQKSMYLPQEVIIEILLRLQVKSLLRFKCVSKSWRSLISDPGFAISHFELAAARTDRLVLVAPSVPEIRSIDFNASLLDDSASAALSDQFLHSKPYHDVRIIGSCRGFLLLRLKHILCVWNPSTGVHKFIYWSPFVLFEVDLKLSFRGFGYDPSTDDYLVVLMPCNYDGRVTSVKFFSFRANAWKEIEATHLSYGDCTIFYWDNEVGLFFNGSIHWVAFSYDISMDVIVAFDCTERSFSKIHLPDDFDINNFHQCGLMVFGELLNLYAVRRMTFSVEIWAMEEYKVQSSWTRTMSVSLDDIPTRFFFLKWSTKSGDLVGEDGNGMLVKYNDKGQLQEHQYILS